MRRISWIDQRMRFGLSEAVSATTPWNAGRVSSIVATPVPTSVDEKSRGNRW
jgi:hypothetical protein